MSRVLVLGGTGAMGMHLLPRLVSKGHEVFATSRNKRSDGDRVTFIKGDAKDNVFLSEVLTSVKPDAIVDFMNYGTIEFMNRRDKLLSSTRHYLFLSSCRVFAGEDLHSEDSPFLLYAVKDEAYRKTDEYALAKAREERLLRESKHTNWTIIRPCITYSAPRFQFGCLEAGTFVVRAFQGLPCVIPEEMLEKRTTMMWGGDTAEMISRLVLRDDAKGEDYNTVTAESHTWREVAELYKEEIGLKYVTCSLDEYCRICNPYQVRYGRMVHHVFDNTKVLNATGMSQADLTTLKDGLKGELAKLQNSGCIQPNIRQNALMDRMLSVRTRLNCGWRGRLEYESVKSPMLGNVIRAVRRLKRHV